MILPIDQIAQAAIAETGSAGFGMFGNEASRIVGQFIGMGNTLLQLGFVVLMTIELYKVIRGEPADFFTPAVKILIASLVLNALVPIGSWVVDIARDFAGTELDAKLKKQLLVTFIKVFEVMKMVKSGEGFSADGLMQLAMSPSGVVFLFSIIVGVLVIVIKYVLIDIIWVVLLIVVVASGALCIPAGVLPGSRSFGGWIHNMLEIALWPVVFNLLTLLMVSTQADTISQISDLNLTWSGTEDVSAIWLVLKSMAINLSFGIIIVFTPKISRMIVKSESASAAGTFAAGMGLAAMTMIVTRVERAGGERFRRIRDKFMGGMVAGSAIGAAQAGQNGSSRDARKTG